MSKPSQNSRYGMHAEDAAGVMTLKSKQHVILNEGGQKFIPDSLWNIKYTHLSLRTHKKAGI